MKKMICALAASGRPAMPVWAQSDAALKAAAAEPGAVVTPRPGLQVHQGRRRPQPKATDTVKVHYKGTFPDGKEFDSSYKTGGPAEFPLNGVIKCWTEGVQR